MKAWMRISGVSLLLTVLAGWSLGNAVDAPDNAKSPTAGQERKAAQYLKEAAELAGKIPAHNPAAAFYRQYIDGLHLLADAAGQPPSKLQREMLRKGSLLQRDAAVNCIRYGIECPYKEWNFIERKFIAEYQALLMIRPLAEKKHDRQMTDFIDKYTLFIHQALKSGATQDIKGSIAEPENKEMRQQLAAVKEKINDYKMSLKKLKPEERNQLQLEGAKTAVQPAKLLSPIPQSE